MIFLGYLRITDLGVSRKWKIENSSDTSGTPGYMGYSFIIKIIIFFIIFYIIHFYYDKLSI